jgi:hypothetical protein
MIKLYAKISQTSTTRPTNIYRFIEKLKQYNGYDVHCASRHEGAIKRDKATELTFFINNNAIFSAKNGVWHEGVGYEWDGIADIKTQQLVFDQLISNYYREYEGTQDEAKANLEKWINTPKESTPQ